MAQPDSNLDRLLRSAAHCSEAPSEAPFGFATRVTSLWRSARRNDLGDLTHFVRIVGMIAIGVTILSGTFAYRQASEDNTDVLTNDYAVADSAIQSELVE